MPANPQDVTTITAEELRSGQTSIIGNAVAEYATQTTRRTVMTTNSKQQDLRTLAVDEIDLATGGIAVGGCFPDRGPKDPKGPLVSVPKDTVTPTCPAPDKL
jgi:hypothetical protein